MLHRARLNPDGVASVFAYADAPDETYTIRQLLALAQRFAAAYRARTPAGQRSPIIICCYHGAKLHAAFLGGLLAGKIPSIMSPPSPRMNQDKYIRSFMKMIEHLEPGLVVTEGVVVESLRGLDAAMLSGERLLDAATLGGPLTEAEQDLDAVATGETLPDEVAFLQHSSGTTGLQKGVALGHTSVLNQIRSYARCIDLSERDVIASWLPLYHDMGLIACFVLPMLTGVPVVEMSPFEWVNQPVLLARKIKQYKATLCWLPNFAYSFMSKAIRESQMDAAHFGSVRAFINCSEPVMAASHEEFAGRFEAHGVAPAQLTACYAMAENVFAVTQSPLGRSPVVDAICKDTFEREHRAVPAADGPSIRLVSNGPPIDDVRIKVIDEKGTTLPERHVGEICIDGTSLFSGYLRRDDLTAEAFLDGWYRTGDLGYLAEGNLYVTGRKKDLIIIQGRNFYPSDLESVVSDVEGVIKGRVVAFGGSDESTGTEALIIIAETKIEDATEQGTLKLTVRAQIAQSFDCTVGGVHLVPPRWMIKSTSGKVARAENRKKYETELKG